MQVLKAAALYFALAFGAGFVLGVVRVLVVVPSLGVRMAELLEMPLMLAVTIAAAAWVVRRQAPPMPRMARLGMGLLALGFLLTIEFTLVLGLQGLSVEQYFANRDPVSGTVYFVLLGVFALMPLLIRRK